MKFKTGLERINDCATSKVQKYHSLGDAQKRRKPNKYYIYNKSDLPFLAHHEVEIGLERTSLRATPKVQEKYHRALVILARRREPKQINIYNKSDHVLEITSLNILSRLIRYE